MASLVVGVVTCGALLTPLTPAAADGICFNSLDPGQPFAGCEFEGSYFDHNRCATDGADLVRHDPAAIGYACDVVNSGEWWLYIRYPA
ncbi:hypothetical protein [Fodinicola feengrottensis]|uniref:hypothetical protein n=1 Tax=Fodinicola feengrottensis TaxID=435914 RepID=UPI0013D846CB|nr:hypothetical protein [Fodinicola feengrottensis]